MARLYIHVSLNLIPQVITQVLTAQPAVCIYTNDIWCL